MGRIKIKAQFFTIDALIALVIIIMTIATFSLTLKESKSDSSISANILDSLSSLKIGEINNTYAKQLIAQSYVSDTDKFVIEQIGEFYVTNITIAKKLSEEVLSSVNPNENIGIWYGTELLASKNMTPFETAKNIFTERQMISGIGGGDGVTGFSARAFLSSNMKTNYVYFGGYVGEGNISTLISYQGNISTAKIELVINKDFDVYVNGVNSGSFSKSVDEFTPVSYNLNTINFTSGDNIVEIKSNNSHIAGGFIKIIYDSNVSYEQAKRYYFPGISGIINLYDGFYVPGNLTGLTISLHFNNSLSTFLTLGNTKVFNNTANDNTTIITNSTLTSLLNYGELSRKTIPLRFGMENVSYISNNTKDVDVFSVTDISGSMAQGCEGGGFFCCMFSGDWCASETTCTSCGGTPENKIQDAKDANDLFIDMILNATGNRVGLSAYSEEATDLNYHSLSNNSVSLKSEVGSWNPETLTCICCGMNKAVTGIVANSTSDKFQSIVMMSDGGANKQCAEQGTGSAKQDAIQSACDAYNNHGIKVYTIAFGAGADVQTLTDMAACGNGSFYSTVSNLSDIYEKIAEELIETAYSEQTIEISEDFFSRLYSDSYIEFEYKEETQTGGLITTIEKPFSTSTVGTFEIPANSTTISANVISYSGPRWTADVNLNGVNIYNLSEYGNDFIKLGDPYSINLPLSLIQNSNTLELKTGLSPSSISNGSINNKIIYTVSKELASYTSVSATADGCNWNVYFNSYNLTMPIPSDYSGSVNCGYGNSTMGGIYCGIYSECEGATDATQIAVYNIFKLLDFNSDGRLDVDLSENDLHISTSNLEGIPFFFSTEVQIRKWR